MTNTIRAREALLPMGWAQDVTIEIDTQGVISNVTTGDNSSGEAAGILLPAPVNLHSHGFQRAMAGLTERRGPDPKDSFWTWRKLMYRFLDQLTPDDVQNVTALVQMEMLEAGYSTNVEFHYIHHQPGGASYDNVAEMSERICAAAETSGIGLTLLPVLYEVGGCDNRPLGPGQIRFGSDPDRYVALYNGAAKAVSALPDDANIGIAPHSLRAVRPEILKTVPNLTQGPLHMHLAEQVAEVTEIEAAWGDRPTRWLLDNMDIDPRWCLIHCTQMEEDETIRLARTGAVAGLCPITESSLGDGIFDGRRYLDTNGRIGIGSDSNIRISLSEEIRTLEYSQRLKDKGRSVLANDAGSTGRTLFDAITTGGAQAAGRNNGKIEVGQIADLMALDDQSADMIGRSGDVALDTWIFAGDDRSVTDVWSAGRHMVQGGHHIHRDAILHKYRETMSRLKDVF